MEAKAQETKATIDKVVSEKGLKRALVEWIKEIAFDYTIGDTMANPAALSLLEFILKQFYYTAARQTLTFDTREYKAIEDETLKDVIFKKIGRRTNDNIKSRLPQVARQISQTANKNVERTTRFSVDEGLTEIEARRQLSNYLVSQSMTIAMSEAQWIVETARNISVIEISGPLEAAADKIVILLENGQLQEALNLSKQVKDVLSVPSSVNQGELMNVIIDNTKKVVDPIEDREEIETIKDQAVKAGDKKKRWQTIGDSKVRSSHQAANGQTVDIDKPFQLAGGMVRYPGDGSMGADLSELVNCRCASIYV